MNTIKLTFCALLLFASCSKSEQRKKTRFDCTVEDITTGIMDAKAHVSLIEIETPPKPFSPVVVSTIEEFSIEYGSSFSHSFKAKRGARFEYQLQFNYEGQHFGSSVIVNDFYYEMNDAHSIEKKVDNECHFKIVPLAKLRLSVSNVSEIADQTDSISLEFSDGMLTPSVVHKGKGRSPVMELDIPHGFYTLSYKVYRNAQLEEDISESIYIKHNADTTIKVLF